MEFRIVQEQLSKCQKSEGVNHYENCKEWADRYLALLEHSKVCLPSFASGVLSYILTWYNTHRLKDTGK